MGIKCINTSGGEPGSDLEIYGHLGAWRILGVSTSMEEHLLMNRMDDSHKQSITQGATLHVGATTPVIRIENNEHLWVGGHLKEYDVSSDNDSLGDKHHKIPEIDLRSGPQIVRFDDGGGQVADAIFEITVLSST